MFEINSCIAFGCGFASGVSGNITSRTRDNDANILGPCCVEITGFACRTDADSTQIRKHAQHIAEDLKVAAYTQ